MNKNSIILITGASGMVGSSLKRYFSNNKYKFLLTPSREELDLNYKAKVNKYLKYYKPEYIFVAAAYVGGIEANMKDPTGFLIKNINIQNNLIIESHLSNINNLLFFGSSCIYPKYANQPIKENEILSGHLEITNEGYALAKITGLKLCEYYRKQYRRNYFTVMPTNIYGENDNYNPKTSHVIPSLISKIKEAKDKNLKEIKLFGTGKAKREFLYVDDLARASAIAMKKNIKYSVINIGSGDEITIKNLAKKLLKIADFKVRLVFDSDIPDGTPRRFLNSKIINDLGWSPKISLQEGLTLVYKMFCGNKKIRI